MAVYDERSTSTFYELERDIVQIAFQIDKYPHLFRKMNWWEGLTNEQLPEFVKYMKKGKVYRLLDPVHDNRIFGHRDDEIENRSFWHDVKYWKRETEPATLAEYETFINDKKK